MFTDEEAKVYDRQIRLWGIHAQQKIRSADVLVVGLAGLATEVVKNLVLTGINSITLIDDKLVTDFDMLSNLFTRNQVGMNRAKAVQKAVQELNPMVTVNIKDTSLATILSDHKDGAKTFIEQFHVVVLVNHDSETTVQLNKLCSECNVPFFSACAWGYFSLVFCDLGKDFNGIDFVPFSDVISKKTFNLGTTGNAKRNLSKIVKFKSIFLVYLTLYKYHEKYGNFPDEILMTEESREKVIENLKTLEKEILQELNANDENNDDDQQQQGGWTPLEGWQSKICGQFTFISSIVGGLLAQDVIRSVTKDNVEFNSFFFDGAQGYNLNMGV